MNWYCVTTPPQNELKAASAIERVGFQVSAPVDIVVKRAQYSKKTDEVPPIEARAKPLIARYVFVRFGDPSDFITMRQRILELPFQRENGLSFAEGRKLITGCLGFNGQYSPIPDRAVRLLETLAGQRSRAAYYQMHNGGIKTRQLGVGDVARIVDGHPFAGRQAEITKALKQYATMLIEALGGMRAVEVDYKWLEAV